MKVISRLGAAFVVLVIIVAVLAGFSTPGGRTFRGQVGDAWRSFWGWAGSLTGGLSGLPTAGNPVAAIAWAAVLFLATLAFIPGVRQGRAFAITALLFTALAFVLYAPGLLTRIGV